MVSISDVLYELVGQIIFGREISKILENYPHSQKWIENRRLSRIGSYFGKGDGGSDHIGDGDHIGDNDKHSGSGSSKHIDTDSDSDKHSDYIHHCIKHGISHTKEHLFFTLFLIITNTFFTSVVLRPKSFLKYFNKYLSVKDGRSIMGVTPFEQLLLYAQSVFVVFFECKFLFNYFAPNSFFADFFWFFVVALLICPVLIRFKIFFERKLHSLSPLFFAIVFIFSRQLYPLVLFLTDRYLLSTLEPYDLEKELESSLHNYRTSLYNSLSEESKNKLQKLKIYYKRSEEGIIDFLQPSIFLLNTYVLIGHKHPVFTESFLAFILRKSLSTTWLGLISQQLLPTLEILCAAALCILFSKYFLKRFCSVEIGHITAFLILEEFLTFGFQRQVFLPFRFARFCIEKSLDRRMVKELQAGEVTGRGILLFGIHGNKSIYEGSLAEVINGEPSVLNRAERMFS